MAKTLKIHRVLLSDTFSSLPTATFSNSRSNILLTDANPKYVSSVGKKYGRYNTEVHRLHNTKQEEKAIPDNSIIEGNILSGRHQGTNIQSHNIGVENAHQHDQKPRKDDKTTMKPNISKSMDTTRLCDSNVDCHKFGSDYGCKCLDPPACSVNQCVRRGGSHIKYVHHGYL